MSRPPLRPRIGVSRWDFIGWLALAVISAVACAAALFHTIAYVAEWLG